MESLAFGGDAVGRQQGGEGARAADDGRATFVPLAAPGERVRVRIEREKGRVAWGELVAIERPGPDRVPPPCPLFGTCGGCQWQQVTIAAQHAAKRAIVERALGVPLTALRRRQSAVRLSRPRQAGGRARGDAGVSRAAVARSRRRPRVSAVRRPSWRARCRRCARPRADWRLASRSTRRRATTAFTSTSPRPTRPARRTRGARLTVSARPASSGCRWRESRRSGGPTSTSRSPDRRRCAFRRTASRRSGAPETRPSSRP